MLTDTQIACAHCTLPVPPGDVRDGDAEQFCCPGCRAVYAQIHACGLEDYYRMRDAGDLMPHAAATIDLDTAGFDSTAYTGLYIRTASDDCETEFALEGITCAACVWLIERLPSRVPGLIDAQMSLADGTLRLRWNRNAVALSQIAAELLRFGYRPHPVRGIGHRDLYRRELRSRLVNLGVAGAIAGNLMLLAAAMYAGWIDGIEQQYSQLLRWLSMALGVTALIWPGREFFRGGLTSIRLRVVNFDLPIAIALATGGIAGTINVLMGRGDVYFDSLAALIFLLLVGRLVQFGQQRRARDAVELLFSLTPSTCRVVAGGKSRTIPIQALRAGDIVDVHADELFPADGVVRTGSTTMDASLLTGESRPEAVTSGGAVFGGARNVESSVHVEVTAAGAASRIGKLAKLIEQGLADKPPIVRLTDRVAARFTYTVLAAAVITFVAWSRFGVAAATETVVALLIVTCPCVLGLAVPMTFALSIGRLARRGILVKSAAALERLAAGGRLVLDKTGTLTTGQMQVVAWEGPTAWQAVVGELERDSAHPVGRALCLAYECLEAPAAYRSIKTIRNTGGGILAECGDHTIAIGSPRMMTTKMIKCPDAFAEAARRHEAMGRSVVLVAVDGWVKAIAALEDTLRPESAATIRWLDQRKFVAEICSGDVQGAVDRIASQLPMNGRRAVGGMSPEEKLATIKDGNAIMVGDGVNDAAALAAADVGIAVAGGAEAALAAADIYISRPGLDGLVELVDTARHALFIVRRNVVIATSYNLLAGTLAVMGYMHPLMAACLMPLSSVTVMSLTILSTRRGPKGSVR